MTSFRKRVLCSLHTLDSPHPVYGSVRRSLFGRVDSELLWAEFCDAMCRDLEDANLRWSFDFAAEKPLDGGAFQWERLPGAHLPALYRPCTVGVDRRLQRAESAYPGPAPYPPSGKENITPGTPEKSHTNTNISQVHSVLLDLEKTPVKQHTLKRKQSNITDFYQAKRRVVATPRKSGQ
ncbi:cyclin-dependent kinase inhibitor 1 [Hoplias malabaricus]|uniref:cyclin-dependent kinase inhibitor 1 n=1 Tax=Hoplias malabaricus TaxID=27720 RepID=UPI003462BEF9